MAAPYYTSCSSIKTNPTSPICSTISSPFSTLFFPFLLFSFSLFSFFLLFHTLFKLLKPHPHIHHEDDDHVLQSHTSFLKFYDDTQLAQQLNSTQLSKESIVLDGGDGGNDGGGELLSQDESGSGEDDGGKKKRKKRRKGKKKDMEFENGGVNKEKDNEKQKEKENENEKEKEKLVCMYPFTSSSSATQRKIKQHYDQLVKCNNDSNGLTLSQVGEFVNCLVDARKELKLKSECLKRKFTITKALLLKADRSSFDRLRKQICKLELEQKRLEEDVFVYNWLQHQLKLSPAYKKMLEVGASMESKAKADELPTESPDDELSDISFEEFLAQEKKDAFWQKYSKSKPSSA